MSDEFNFSLTQSTSLSDLTAEKRSSACTDYVMYRKLTKRCRKIIEDEIKCCAIFKITEYKVWKVKKDKLIEKADDIFNRASHLLLEEYFYAYNEMDDADFIKFVLKTNPRK